jgi:hypothetical protein
LKVGRKELFYDNFEPCEIESYSEIYSQIPCQKPFISEIEIIIMLRQIFEGQSTHEKRGCQSKSPYDTWSIV